MGQIECVLTSLFAISGFSGGASVRFSGGFNIFFGQFSVNLSDEFLARFWPGF